MSTGALAGGRRENSGRAGFFFLFFSFLDLGLSYTVVWVVQDSVSFTQWFVYSFSSEVGNSFTLTF